VLSISGGSGVVFADAAVRGGLSLPPFAPETLARLRQIIPAFGSPENPADFTAAVFNDPTLFSRSLEVVLDDPGLDQLVILLASITGARAASSAEIIAAAAAKTDKPVYVSWSGRLAKSEEAVRIFEQARLPHITTPVRLARAAAIVTRFASNRRRLLPRQSPPVAMPAGLTLPDGAVTLNEAESKAILAAFGFPVGREVFVAAGRDPARAAEGLKAPFAVKVVSRDVAHKTEAGGVRLNVAKEGVAEAVRSVMASAAEAVPGARIDGVLISEMAQGIEALIGVVNDEAFGPTVALGLGGVLTEVLRDVTYRIAPFDIDTAREMIAELRGARLFDGYRGRPGGDKEALARALVAVSQMAAALAPRLKELDINPVFVGPSGVVAADALLVLKA
jgi:acetyltransferase